MRKIYFYIIEMFAPTYSNVSIELFGDITRIEFTYRDDDDIPERFWMIVEKDQVASNCDSAALLEEVFYEGTGNKIFLHPKFFNIGYHHFYRIYNV